MHVILASQSPRRYELLRLLSIPFRVISVDVQEICSGEPEVVAMENAQTKAASVGDAYRDMLVIGADTIVVLEREILGKPCDEADAYRMLAALSGRTHEVITGVALRNGRKSRLFAVSTKVTFRKLESYEIQCYIDSGEPLDKAGSYGIQGIGGVFVESICGCYYNVVGLPISRLAIELRAFGTDVFRAQGR